MRGRLAPGRCMYLASATPRKWVHPSLRSPEILLVFAVPYDLERTQVLPWAFLIGQSHVFRRQAHAMHIHIHMPRMHMRRKLIFSFQSDDTRAKLSASLGPRPLEGLSGGSARRPTGQCTTWITGVQRGRISARPGHTGPLPQAQGYSSVGCSAKLHWSEVHTRKDHQRPRPTKTDRPV